MKKHGLLWDYFEHAAFTLSPQGTRVLIHRRSIKVKLVLFFNVDLNGRSILPEYAMSPGGFSLHPEETTGIFMMLSIKVINNDEYKGAPCLLMCGCTKQSASFQEDALTKYKCNYLKCKKKN